jgi:isopenicillin N synthase-like dioxygenase
MTLLVQDGASGLQARSRDGGWTDVPPHEHSLAVNFGQVLERWCGGRIKATEHRVIVTGQERYSIPFFYEARADAEISPLPMDDPATIYGLASRSSWNFVAWKACANQFGTCPGAPTRLTAQRRSSR